jgi:hypothetical protein
VSRYMTTREFGAKHNISDSRVRQLLRENRVFPAEKVSPRLWLIYPNAVIVAPYHRPKWRPTQMLTETG